MQQPKKFDHPRGLSHRVATKKGNRLGGQEFHTIGGSTEGSPLEKKLGITKQRVREVRKALSVLKVGAKEVKDISFVGKQVCTMLTTSSYAPTLIRKIVLEVSAIAHLEKVQEASRKLKTARGKHRRRRRKSMSGTSEELQAMETDG